MEAAGQDVDQKAADELVRRQGHDLVAGSTLLPVILPFEANAFVVTRYQSAVGDGDAVGVAAEIGEYGVWSGKRAFGIDHPFHIAQGSEMFGEGCFIAQMLEFTEEVEASGLVRVAKPFEEQSAEQPRQHAHGQEEAGPTIDPALTIRGDAAARHNTVDVRMMS